VLYLNWRATLRRGRVPSANGRDRSASLRFVCGRRLRYGFCLFYIPMSQQQFLAVIDRDEAERRFRAALRLMPLGTEIVPLDGALGRVVADDLIAPENVPSFDRSNYDGYAVRAADTWGASEERPRQLQVLPEVLSTGVVPRTEVLPGTAIVIETGGMLPRGADAVVMVEHTEQQGDVLLVHKPVTAGFGVSYAGTDISAGETVVRSGTVLTSRETGVLAAVGIAEVKVFRRPRVAIISTGNELIAPGEPMRPARIYDSNSRIIADAVREAGGEPIASSIVPDQLEALRAALAAAVQTADVVLLSGGTSKGAGDISYRAVEELARPGIVAHGVALKPGKPICLAAHEGKPVVVLPGFPTSAIFTFHEFVAPVIRILAGLSTQPPDVVQARLAVKINSELGRTEYVLVSLVQADGSPGHSSPDNRSSDDSNDARPSAGALPAPVLSRSGRELVAYPIGKGSGSVTTFSHADGVLTIGRHETILEAGTTINVKLLGGRLRVADLVSIGSHCIGLDYLLSLLHRQGFITKQLNVGSTAGLQAAQRGECDIAGIHLLDPTTGQYNRPFLNEKLELLPGYGRMQGIVFRAGDKRFEGRSAEEAIQLAIQDPNCVMVNRNTGSGTRLVIDRLLRGAQPPGYAVQPTSHTAVVAAVAQGRADWGVAIEPVARTARLGFLPLWEERYDFVIPRSRLHRPAVVAFCRLLADSAVRRALTEMGLRA